MQMNGNTDERKLRLYPWQEECLELWKEADFHGIVNVVTGAGKTVLALAASAYLKEYLADADGPEKSALRVRIVVPSVPLARQWLHELRNVLPSLGIEHPKCGLYYSGQKGTPEQDYMIYVLNSARFSIARHILSDIRQGFHVLLIVDECHRCASPENQRIFGFLDQEASSWQAEVKKLYHSLGLSATIRSEDYETVLKPALGKEIYRYHFSSAVRDGYVSRFAIFHTALSFSAAELREYAVLSDQMSALFHYLADCYPHLRRLEGARLFTALRKIAESDGEDSEAALYLNLAYKRKTVSCMAVSRVSCAVSLVKQLDPAAKILIFGERIQQAEQVWQALSARYPGRVGRYHSQMSVQAKRNTMEAYRDGRLRILVSCRGLDEGIDVPEASVGIVLSGSSVSRQRIQRLGRILRRRDDKSSACLYYFYIKESSEDAVYLPNPDSYFPVCSLSYSAQDQAFCHPAYEELAARFLEEAGARGLSKKKLKELRACLLLGLPRADWLEGPERCAAGIRQAKSRREKNYWICMKRMAQMRNA